MKLITTLHTIPIITFQKIAFRRALIANLYFAVIYCLITLDAALTSIKGGFYLFVGTPLMACGVSAVLLAFISSRSKRQLKLNKGAFERKRLCEFDDDGFLTRFESGSYSYHVWSDIESAEYRDQCTYLFPSKLYILQVPDIAWPSAVELNQFLSLLRSKSLLK
jgi:hypothetical protein